MLIGVSGKAQSGKDEFGKIYQYVTAHYSAGYSWKPNEEDYKSWLKNGHQKQSSIAIKKYADKLKDIVCILLNCTREQLESEEFKNKPLGENWDRWELQNYSGLKRIYSTHHEALKVYEESKDSWDDISKVIKRVRMTPRLLMQLLGTECGRKIIHPDIWVNSLIGEYDSYRDNTPMDRLQWFESRGYNVADTEKLHGEIYKELKEEFFKYLRSFLPFWIITDVRFPNEVLPIEERGGFVVRMVRYPKTIARLSPTGETIHEEFSIDNPEHVKYYESQCRTAHESERALDDHTFKHYIFNNGTIGDLINKVMLVMKKENIIG